MKTASEIISIAQETLRKESEVVSKLIPKVNNDFVEIIQFILTIKGRVIITGIGKSAIIAQKIVATLNSTGTPSIFMHAADAIHGDLGMIQKDDVVICISKSGNTPEIKALAPLLKISNKLIAMVGDLNSYLAKNADWILDTTVDAEACPNNLAPTTSTTAQLAMGDALAVALLSMKSFTKEDFAKYHPGGALGKRLYLKTSDLANANKKPQVKPNSKIKEVLMEITTNRLGCVAVVNETNHLEGIITDGDIRRMLEKNESFSHISAQDIMTKTPKTIQEDVLAIEALYLMREENINQLVVKQQDKYFGIVHIHDLLREGLS